MMADETNNEAVIDAPIAAENPQGAEGMANIPDSQLDAVIESAEECPGECIFIEA